MTIERLLIKHEGLRKFPYKDTVGKLTVGVGRNLDDRGITEDEALYMLKNDIEYFSNELSERLYWFDTAPEEVKMVLTDMTFNMGTNGLMTFKTTLEHLKNQNYILASESMLKSKWATQVGERATELSEIIKNIKL